MSMTREELKRAFQEAVALEFVDIPTEESEIDYTFSDTFLQKMDTLIASQKKTSWNLFHYVKRNIAVIAIVLLGLSATACGVTQVIYHLHEDIYKENKEEMIGNSELQGEEIMYRSLTYLPEGFTKTGVSKNAYSKQVEYKTKGSDRIIFLQDIKGESQYILNEEQVTKETVQINGKEVDLYKNNQLMGAIWVEDGIYMEILFYGCDDMEELKAIVEGVK